MGACGGGGRRLLLDRIEVAVGCDPLIFFRGDDDTSKPKILGLYLRLVGVSKRLK
jgi:hypothetical protein